MREQVLKKWIQTLHREFQCQEPLLPLILHQSHMLDEAIFLIHPPHPSLSLSHTHQLQVHEQRAWVAEDKGEEEFARYLDEGAALG